MNNSGDIMVAFTEHKESAYIYWNWEFTLLATKRKILVNIFTIKTHPGPE